MLQKLGNRIQEYPEECLVVFKMLQNETIRMCKFGAIGSIGSIGRISRTIPVHLELGGILSGSDFYNV